MRKRRYRLSAHPKGTIREKQGSHRDLSNCRLDFTPKERAIFASQMAQRNMLIKEQLDAWEQRSCNKGECTAALEVKRHRLITCPEIERCPWARYHKEHNRL